MKKRDLIIYRIVLALFTMMLLMGVTMYFVQYRLVSEIFTSLGFYTAIIYPLAILKLLGLAVLWFIKNPVIKTLVYLGLAIDLVLAIIAHLNAGDGEAIGPAIPLVLIVVSYLFYRKTRKQASTLAVSPD